MKNFPPQEKDAAVPAGVALEEKKPPQAKAPPGWQVYRSPKCGYSVWLPGLPTATSVPTKGTVTIPEQTKADPKGMIHQIGNGLKLDGEVKLDAPRIVYQVEFQAGKTYQIDMKGRDSKKLDPYLTLLDAEGNILAEDDDSGGDLNARIFHEARETTIYQVVASSFVKGTGPFSLDIAEVVLTAEQKSAASKLKQKSTTMDQVQLDDPASGLHFMVICADPKKVFPDADLALDAARDGAIKGGRLHAAQRDPDQARQLPRSGHSHEQPPRQGICDAPLSCTWLEICYINWSWPGRKPRSSAPRQKHFSARFASNATFDGGLAERIHAAVSLPLPNGSV